MYEERIRWARNRALRALREAIDAIDAGLTPDERRIFRRWFPAATAGDYALIRGILARTRSALVGAPIRYIDSVARHEVASGDGALHAAALRVGKAAIAVIEYTGGRIRPVSDRYIALYPRWANRRAYAATIILHEAFHYHDPARFGSTAMHTGFFDATRFQAFVSDLTDLPYRRALVRRAVRTSMSESP